MNTKNPNSELVKDIRKYLLGDMKMKEINKLHKISHHTVQKIIGEMREMNTLFTDELTQKINERYTVPSPKISVPFVSRREMRPIGTDEVFAIIKRQLRIEKGIRVTEEVSQNITIPEDWYKTSKLVNKQRIFGLD